MSRRGAPGPRHGRRGAPRKAEPSGLSPHERGAVVARHGRVEQLGSIPAHAGMLRTWRLNLIG